MNRFYDEKYFSRYASEADETYQGQGSRQVEPTTFLDKLRVHLSWRADRGQPVDADMVHRIVGGKPSRVCDIGCGNGNLLAGIREMGHEVLGVEVDPIAVERARSRGLAVYAGTGEDLPPQVEAGSYDVVLMTHVLEHCRDPIQALRNASARLRPGGRLIVEVPNNDSILGRRAGGCWFYCDAGRHVNFFTTRSLTLLYRKIGLEAESVGYSGYCSAFLNGRVTAENIVFDLLYDSPEAAVANGDSLNSRRRQWGTLLQSMAAHARRKYEVVHVVGRRAAGPSGPDA